MTANAAAHTIETALLFPGQGSQEPNMGRDLAEASRDAMDLWKSAEKISGVELREVYWDGDEAAMARTRYLQPALTVVNLSLFQHLAGRLNPMCMAGHSLGEYSALAAAGVLSPGDVLQLVSLRGQLMDDADPHGAGAMAAVLKLDQPQVEELVDQVRGDTGKEIRIANYNSPAQFVISGAAAAVEAAGPLVKERKGRLVPLAVSGAFHSPLMADAATELAGVIRKTEFRPPRVPVYFNVTGAPEPDPEAIRETMARQMTSSVLWMQTVRAIWNDAGARRFLEIGPKQVLTRLLAANLADLAERDGEEYAAEAVGSLEAIDGLE